jgi:CRISPR type III-A-associated RAMP protein Csm4
MESKTFNTYYLHFNSPLHIGDTRPQEYGNTELFIRSDTLYAAILASWAKVGKPIPSDGNPGFHISSLFPFTTVQGEITHFFPKILKPFNFKGTVDFAKKLKKLQWLDKDYFEYQINDASIENFGDQDQNDIQGIFCSKKQVGEVFKTQVSQRVVIPRIREGNEDPRPFYMERIFFQKKIWSLFPFQRK